MYNHVLCVKEEATFFYLCLILKQNYISAELAVTGYPDTSDSVKKCIITAKGFHDFLYIQSSIPQRTSSGSLVLRQPLYTEFCILISTWIPHVKADPPLRPLVIRYKSTSNQWQ